MRTYKISITSLMVLLFLVGCSNDRKKFFEDERYEKMVYIVSDDKNIHDLVYDLDSKDNNMRNLSIACSGTNPTTEPINITLTEDSVLLDEYNYTNFDDTSRYAIKMDPADYKMESSKVTYPAGKPYTLVPITIDISVIEGLDPDKTYFIPIAIESSDPYPIVKKKGNALLRVQKKNKYTSTANPVGYNASGYEGPGYFNITKNLIPLTKNRVRVNIGAKKLPADISKQPDFIKKNTVIINIAENNTLTVEPYDPEELTVETLSADELHPGDGAYSLYNNKLDTKSTTFGIYYRYKLKAGSWTEMREAIRLPIITIE